MIRKIIQIDTDKCNGCGACANACHEGAIDMVNGKAVLTPEMWKKRSGWKKFLGWVGNLLTPFL